MEEGVDEEEEEDMMGDTKAEEEEEEAKEFAVFAKGESSGGDEDAETESIFTSEDGVCTDERGSEACGEEVDEDADAGVVGVAAEVPALHGVVEKHDPDPLPAPVEDAPVSGGGEVEVLLPEAQFKADEQEEDDGIENEAVAAESEDDGYDDYENGAGAAANILEAVEEAVLQVATVVAEQMAAVGNEEVPVLIGGNDHGDGDGHDDIGGNHELLEYIDGERDGAGNVVGDLEGDGGVVKLLVQMQMQMQMQGDDQPANADAVLPMAMTTLMPMATRIEMETHVAKKVNHSS